jgi:membrane protein implicated in regulation of membrane protease activity
MQEILNILLWTGMVAGGLLVLLLLLSILGGLDIGGDVDVDTHDADGSVDHAPLGILKTVLTFVSVSAFTARAFLLNTSWSWLLVALTAAVAGAVAVLLLSLFFRWLLKNQEEGNWHMWQTEGKMGTVYVPIPARGKGRIRVRIDNSDREVNAKSRDGQAMATHDKVLVVEAREDFVLVVPVSKNPIDKTA